MTRYSLRDLSIPWLKASKTRIHIGIRNGKRVKDLKVNAFATFKVHGRSEHFIGSPDEMGVDENPIPKEHIGVDDKSAVQTPLTAL